VKARVRATSEPARWHRQSSFSVIAGLAGVLLVTSLGAAEGENNRASRARGVLKLSARIPRENYVLSRKVIFEDPSAEAVVVFWAADRRNYVACAARSGAIAVWRVVNGKREILKTAAIQTALQHRVYRVNVSVCAFPAVSRDEHGPAWYIGGTRRNVCIKAKIWHEDEPEPGWQITFRGMIEGAAGERIGFIDGNGVRFLDWIVYPLWVKGTPEEVAPARVIRVPQGREAEWLAIGDLDNDGDIDFLTARNANQAVTALTAYDRDGNLLWNWGQGGSPIITYDVPVQIYDIDGDGESEVLYTVEGYLVVANGSDGTEEEKWPLPDGLRVADCIVIANFTGKSRPSDILIKSRYNHVWAYDSSFKLLWEWKGNTGHHPSPDDIDADGKDELLCGYTLLNDDGREIWRLEPEPPGHADTARISWNLDGESPGRPWYLTTCCDGKDLILTDHFGKRLWQMSPKVVLHFQSARVAELRPDIPGREIVVDIAGDPAPSPDRLMLLDAKGNVLGSYMPDYTRFHDVIDWDGDGVMEIIIPRADGLFDGSGRQLVRFLNPPPHPSDRETPFCYAADVYGDGNDDVILLDDSSIRIYSNAKLLPREPKHPVMKRHYNFTFY